MIGIANNFHPHSGIGKASFRLLEGLNQRNTKTQMCYLESSDNEIGDVPNVRKINQGFRYPIANRTLSAYYSFPKKMPGGYDLYHASSQYTARIAKFRSPCIISHMDLAPILYPENFPLLLRIFLKKSLKYYQYAERIICISDSSRDGLIEYIDNNMKKNGPNKENILSIPLGFDPKIFRALNKANCRKKLGLPSDKKIILNIGSEEERKNIPALLKSMKIINRDDVMLVRVGAKNPKYEEEKKGIEIRHFNGVKEEDLPLFYNAADVFAFPSIYEGFGYPPAEAMACGLPTIVAKNLYYFKDGAMVMEESDEPAASGSILADAIIKLLDNPTISKKYSQKALSTAAEFTLDKTVEKTIKVYEDILS